MSSAMPGSKPAVGLDAGLAAVPRAGRWRRAMPWLLLLAGLGWTAREAWLWRETDALNRQIARGVPLPSDASAAASSALAAASAKAVAAPPVEVPPQPVSGEALAASAASAASGPPRAPASPAWLRDPRPLPWRFAEASALAAAGQDEAALARYRSLYDDPTLGLAARYNAANLLLRQGMALREGPQPGSALPLIELAKEGYRQVLRQEPGHASARYNLERAQRLIPEQDEEDLAGAAPENAERAATTMRGVSQGLP